MVPKKNWCLILDLNSSHGSSKPTRSANYNWWIKNVMYIVNPCESVLHKLQFTTCNLWKKKYCVHIIAHEMTSCTLACVIDV